MKNLLRWLTVFAVAVPVVQTRAGGIGDSLDLVRDGRTVATIVAAAPGLAVEPGPSKGKVSKRKRTAESDEDLAVRTLVQWVKKITDLELPVADKVPDGSPAIYVGRAAVAAGLKLDDIVSASHEGIRIVADGRRVLIAGQSEAATLKAGSSTRQVTCRLRMPWSPRIGAVRPR